MDSNLVFDFVIVKSLAFLQALQEYEQRKRGMRLKFVGDSGIRVVGRQQCVCFLLLLNTSLQPSAFSSSRAPFSVLTIV